MPDFRRYFVPGGTYFFTLVTAGRRPIFAAPEAAPLLGECLRREKRARPFEVTAIVVLPDHLHTIWALPPGDCGFSVRWASIKAQFTRGWLAIGGAEEFITPAQGREGRRGIWQPRFLEHTIRDEDDLIDHANYLHYNPVRHGHARCPKDWPWSSFLRFVAHGDYPLEWGCSRGPAPRFPQVDADLFE